MYGNATHRTAKLKLAAMAILGPTATFNSYQYFQLYGTLVAELTFDSAGDEDEAIFVDLPDVS